MAGPHYIMKPNTIQTNVVYICEPSSHNLSCEGDIRTHPYCAKFPEEKIFIKQTNSGPGTVRGGEVMSGLTSGQ